MPDNPHKPWVNIAGANHNAVSKLLVAVASSRVIRSDQRHSRSSE
jgi:hypothetical protein